MPAAAIPHSSAPWRAELRACLALGLPLVATNAIETGMGLTNTVVIGRLSPDDLAASWLAMTLYIAFLVFGIGLTAAVSSLVSRERGRDADDTAAVRRLVQGGLWNAMVIALPMSAVLWQGGPILRAVGQDPALADKAASYLHAMQGSLIPALAYLVLRSFLAALERPRWAVATGAGGVALNGLFNWLLVEGHAGCPALGLVGSGLATLLANLLMALALGLVVARDPGFRRYRVFAGLARPPWRACGALWRLGLPIGTAIVIEVGMFTAGTGLVGHYDPGALAAHAIALQIASFTFMVPLGIAQAATVRIGQAHGARDPLGVGRAGWTALALGVGFMAGSGALLVACARPIAGLFVDDAQAGAAAVARDAVPLLAIAGLFQVADGAQVVLSGMLRGLQDTRVPMVAAAIGYWGVGLPFAALLATRAGAPGVWIGLTAGLFTAAGLLLARWSSWRPSPAP